MIMGGGAGSIVWRWVVSLSMLERQGVIAVEGGWVCGSVLSRANGTGNHNRSYGDKTESVMDLRNVSKHGDDDDDDDENTQL